MDKSGQIDTIYIVILAFLVGITILVVAMVWPRISSALNQATDTELNPVFGPITGIINAGDEIFLTIFAISIIISVYSAWKIPSDKGFLPIGIISTIIGVVFAWAFGKAWKTLKTSSVFGFNVSQTFPKMSFVLDQNIFPMAITLIGFVLMIVMYSQTKGMRKVR